MAWCPTRKPNSPTSVELRQSRSCLCRRSLPYECVENCETIPSRSSNLFPACLSRSARCLPELRSGFFNQIDDFAHCIRMGQAARLRRKLFNLSGLVQEGENLFGQTFRVQFRLGDQPSGTRVRHFLGVAELVAVRRFAKRNENRCP